MNQPFLIETADRWARYAARAGGAVILAIAVMVTINTLARKYLGVTFKDMPEIAGYMFAIAVSFSYSLVFIRRLNVRIDTLYNLLPRPVGAVFDVLAAVSFFLVSTMLAYYAVKLLVASWTGNSLSISALATPLWIPQTLWLAGLVLLCVVSLLVSVHAVLLLFQRRFDAVAQIAGIPSIQQEIDEFTEQSHKGA